MSHMLTPFIDDRRYSYIMDDKPDKEQFPLWYLCEKEEVILNPGERLFIPAGWFHFVFSEGDGLNAAVNFWYGRDNYGESIESDMKPIKDKHNITVDDIKGLIGDSKLKFSKAKGKVFPPIQLFHTYPKGYIDFVSLTFDEFLESKSSRFYAVQNQIQNAEHLAPPHPRPNEVKNDLRVYTWLNFGKGARSLPHYDMEDNWLCQVSGTKRIILVEQKFRHLLYLRNPYILPFLNEVFHFYESSKTHPHVFIKQSLTELECNFIKEKDEIKNTDLLFSHLNKILLHEGVNFIKMFQRMNLVVSPPEDVKSFKLEKVKEVKRDVLDIDDSIYTALWSVSKSLIYIAEKPHYLNPGDFIIFPTQLTYTWYAEPGSVIIYPVYKD